MAIVQLHKIAHGRTGDKGNRLNISIIPYEPDAWPILLKEVTEERVHQLFRHRGATKVVRYVLPKLRAMNFVIDNVLEGGVNSSLAVDAHGKSHSFRLLGLEIEVPDGLIQRGKQVAGQSASFTNAGFKKDVQTPREKLPAGACDTHMHIVGPLATYPLRETRSLTPREATWDDYQAMARTVGLDRCVIVQPSFFAFDNACTLDSVGRSGNRARAIVVVKPDVAKADLEAMHHRGARGARAQTVVAGGMSFDAIEEISKRIAPFGWHLQLYLDARSLPDLVQRLRRLPVDVVFDHMAHIQPDSGMEEPGFVALLNLLADGKACHHSRRS